MGSVFGLRAKRSKAAGEQAGKHGLFVPGRDPVLTPRGSQTRLIAASTRYWFHIEIRRGQFGVLVDQWNETQIEGLLVESLRHAELEKRCLHRRIRHLSAQAFSPYLIECPDRCVRLWWTSLRSSGLQCNK